LPCLSDALHTFPSLLPNGRPRSGPKDGWTVLDCVFHEPDQTYYVLDMLCWRGFELYDCTAEFRLFFLRSKFTEELSPGGIAAVGPSNRHRFVPVVYQDADPAGIMRMYQGPVPFLRDGLVFVNKQGYYELGLSPLQLVWKDASTCRYLSTQDAQKAALAIGTPPGDDDPTAVTDPLPLVTMDGVRLGGISRADMQRLQLHPGDLLWFTLGGAAEVRYRLEGSNLARNRKLELTVACRFLCFRSKGPRGRRRTLGHRCTTWCSRRSARRRGCWRTRGARSSSRAC
jgi:snurportin-1